MPLGDFSVEGIVEAVDSVSKPMGDIARSVAEASGAMEEASGSASDLNASLASTAAGSEVAEEGIEDVNDELEKLNTLTTLASANATGAASAITALGAADMGEIADDPEAFEDFFSTEVPSQLLQSDEFRQSLAEGLDPAEGGRAGFSGRLAGQLSQMDDVTVGDLSERLSGRSDVDSSQAVALQAISAAAKEAGMSMNLFEEQTEDADDSIQQTSVSSLSLVGAAQAASSAMGFFGLVMGQTEEKVEDVEDEVDKLRNALIQLGPALSTVSANLGPFNFGLSNLIVTVPVLVGTIGPLIVALLGIASAAVAAGAALTAFAGVGAFALMETLQENFAGITNRMEALEAIASGLGQALGEAFGPLFEAEFAGMGPMEFFVRIIQNAVYWLYLMADAFAEILEMEEVESFFFRVEEALLGLGDETGGATMLEGMEAAIESMLPMFTDLVVFLIDELPDALIFFAEITEEIGPELGALSLAVIDLLASIIKLGAIVGDVVLPGLTSVISGMASLFNILIAVHDALGPLGDLWIGLMVSVLATIVVFVKIAGVLVTVTELITALQALNVTLSASFLAVAASVGTLLLGLLLLTGHLDVMEGPIDRVIGAVLSLAGAFAILHVTGVASISSITAALIGSGWGVALIAIGAMIYAIYEMDDAWGLLAVAATTAIAAITTALISSGWGGVLVALASFLSLLIFRWDTLRDVATNALDAIDNSIHDFIDSLGATGTAGNIIADVLSAIVKWTLFFINMGPALLGILRGLLDPDTRADWLDSILSKFGQLRNLVDYIVAKIEMIPGVGSGPGTRDMGIMERALGAGFGAVSPVGPGVTTGIFSGINAAGIGQQGRSVPVSGGTSNTTNQSSVQNTYVEVNNEGEMDARDSRRVAEIISNRQSQAQNSQDGFK
jgi:hypothetical protein